MGLLSYVGSSFLRKCSRGNSGVSRLLHSNNSQRKLTLSSGNESLYGHFGQRSYTSLNYMGAGSEIRTTGARIKMPNLIGSGGLMGSTYVSTAMRNSRSIHFNSSNTTVVNPEQVVQNSEVLNVTNEIVKQSGAPRWNIGDICTVAPCDAPEPWQMGFQDAASPMMQGIIDLHHDINFFNLQIAVFVTWILGRALWHFSHKRNPIPQRIVHGTTIEIIWTMLPSIILMFIAIPSFALLYSMDEGVVDPAITIKAIGHQWYWSYEYSDYNSSDEQSLAFDSYMIPESDLELGQLRLLEVDNRVIIPAKTHVRVLITSADVLHSWAVPSLGIKCDAVPGRLNQVSVFAQREGVYYGQCSEICGTNHAFMPIIVEAVTTKDYSSWVSNQLN